MNATGLLLCKVNLNSLNALNSSFTINAVYLFFLFLLMSFRFCFTFNSITACLLLETVVILTWSSGPTETLVTLLEMSSQADPCG